MCWMGLGREAASSENLDHPGIGEIFLPAATKFKLKSKKKESFDTPRMG